MHVQNKEDYRTNRADYVIAAKQGRRERRTRWVAGRKKEHPVAQRSAIHQIGRKPMG